MADNVQIKITANSEELQAALSKAEASLKQLQDTVKGSADGLAPMDAATRELIDTWDKGTGTLQKSADAFAAVNEALEANQISGQQAIRMFDSITAASKQAAGGHEEFSLATAGARRELIVLGHEAAMGNWTRLGPSMMVLAERTGGLSLGMMGVGAAVAFAGLAIGEMVVHAEALDRELGTMEAGLIGAGRGADATREALVGVVEQIREIPGISTKAAEQLVTDFTHQREIGVGSYVDLGNAAAGFARATGKDVPAAGQMLTQALGEGYTAILKLDASYNVLTPSQRAQILAFGEMGDKAAVLNVAIPALADHFGAVARAGLTPMQQAAENFGTAWDKMLDSLHNTGPIEQARRAITNLLNETARGMTNSYDPGNLEKLKSDLAALQSQRDRLQGEHDGGFFGALNAPQSAIDDLDQQIAKTKELIAAKQQAVPAQASTLPNGENDPNAIIKDALGLEQQLGLEASKREQIEGRIAELKRGAATASVQADKASASGDSTGAANYQEQAARLTADAAELQNQLDQLHSKGGEKRIQQWQDQLDQQLLAQNKFGEEAKQAEVTFWQARLSETTAGTAEQLAVEKRLYQARSSLQTEQAADAKRAQAEADAEAKARFDADVSALRDQQAAHKDDFTIRIQIEQQILDMYKEFYGDDTKAYGDELKRKEELLQQYAAQQQRIAEIVAQGERARAKIQESEDTKRNPGSTSYGIGSLLSGQPNDDLAAQQAKLAADNEAQQAAMRSSLSTATNPADQMKIYQDLLTGQAEYNAKSNDLNRQAAANVQKSWEGMLAPIDHAFSSSIDGMLQGTETLRQGIARAGQSIALSFIDAAEKSAMKWVASELAKLTITETTQAGMTTATAANQAAQTAIKQEGKTAEAAMDSGTILNNAYTAATGAFSAVAGIPIVGPILAPIAAAAAFAGVMAFDVISAAGGMGNVPFDDMPALLHRKEMVLPSSIAEPLRSAIGTWGMPQAPANANMPAAANLNGGGGGDIHLHAPIGNINTPNADVSRHAILSALNDAARNGVSSQYPHLKKLLTR